MAQAPFDPRNVCSSNCPSCNDLHAGQKECTGRPSCAVHKEYAAYSQRACSDRSNEVRRRKATTKRQVVLALGGMFGLLSIAACSTIPRTVCSAADVPTRFTAEQIDKMTDQQVRNELARNEDLEQRGCAVPNK